MLQQFQMWFQQPFATNQDTWHWFLFIGLLLVIAGLWGIIFSYIGV